MLQIYFILYKKNHAAFLASFNNSKTLLARYFCRKDLFLFLSGCVFIKAFLQSIATSSALSNSDKDTADH